MPWLSVQHCVLNHTTRQYGQPFVSSDLLRVNYFQTVPADTEFPARVGKLELFVRFIIADLPPTHVRVSIRRRGDGGLVYNERVVVNRVRLTGSNVVDRSYKLMNLEFPSEGGYTIRLSHRHQGLRRVLASEPFWLSRAT